MHRLALSLFAIVSILPRSAIAQTTFGAITGTVHDSTGAVAPGVSIEAVHVESNYRYSTVSNETGTYTLPQLREGAYILRATLQGFREFVAKDIQLAARDERRVDIVLEVGGVTAAVEIVAEPALIETETARIGDSKDSNELKALPLNTRSLYNFLALSPGVVAAGGGESFRRFAGSRRNQSDQSIDGVSVSTGQDGTQITPLVQFIESFQEVRIDMANNNADIGAVGQVTLISKSGTNELHGSVFDYYSTPWFRAVAPFATERQSGVRHNPGGSVGGPIVVPGVYNGHNKSFFFYAFETSRGSNVLDLVNPTVPLEVWRGGCFPGVTIRDPFNNNQPFANGCIPPELINSVSKKIQDQFWPLPNVQPGATTLPANNYKAQLSRPFDPNTYWTARIDHRFSDRATVFGRWTWNKSYNRAYESNLPTIGQLDRFRDTRAATLSMTYTISPRLVSESRYGMAYSNDPRHGPLRGLDVVNSLGLQGLVDNLPDTYGVPNVSFSGLGVTTITQTAVRDPGFKNFVQQWQEHLNYYRGRHSIKGGFQVGRYDSADLQQNNALFGSLSFSNRYTGHPYADFLLGLPSTVTRANPAVLIDRLRWGYDFFATDDFKISSRLTLNLGVRYEFHPNWTEANGLLSAFDLSTGKIVVPDGSLGRISPLLPRGYVDVVEASSAGYPSDTLIKTDKNNFASRLGFAYRPWGNTTVIRAGFGIFYDVVTRAASSGGTPFVINEPSFTNPANNPVVILPRVFPAAGVGGPTTVSLPQAVRTDLRVPYSMQYNLTIEHQRWNTGFRISYVGTNTRQGDYTMNVNQPVPDDRLYVDKPRLFPNYPAINLRLNGAGHQYHAMTIEAERRFTKGISYQASWTWAKDIEDLNGFLFESPENAFDRLRERGNSLDTPRHRVTANTIFELPFGEGKRFLGGSGRGLNAIVGGWESSWIFSYYSGQFLTPQWTGPDPTGTAFTSNRTPANVTLRPDVLRDPNLPSSERTVSRWFDPTAFGPPQPGHFGTSSKGVIVGPGNVVFDAGLAKHFRLHERTRLRLELTATNLFNHPSFGNPAVDISKAATVGVISGVKDSSDLDQSGARSFRTAIRLEW
jgi:hypothetical protein